jgi:mannosylglucosylglycerate synthase
VSHTAPLAFFNHPEVAEVQNKLFGVACRTRIVGNQIQSIKERLKDGLYRFIEKFQLEVLVPENILAIPMHVPLTVLELGLVSEL